MVSSILIKLIILTVVVASAPATAQEREAVVPNCPSVVATLREMPDRAIITASTEARAREPEPARRQSGEAMNVRIDDMSRISRTIDAIVQAGANILGDPRYDLQNRDAVEDEALKRAVVDARASADAAASGAELSVRRVLRIEQHDTGSRPPVPMMMAARSAEEATTPIVPGPIEITEAVTLTACMR